MMRAWLTVHTAFWGLLLVLLAGCGLARNTVARAQTGLPVMAWDHRPEAADWTRATLQALKSHGKPLLQIVPVDIATYCPAYPKAGPDQRAAFWSGILSALAKHESTWRPDASGGGGLWIGLTQIDPRTARAFDCETHSVAGLKDGSANLSCAVRIATAQVARDNAVVSIDGKWRGLARDWAPFRSTAKRQDMRDWVSRQSYCAL